MGCMRGHRTDRRCLLIAPGPKAPSVAPSSNPSIALPNQDAEYVSHIALDIGGSLIKLVYFSPDPSDPAALDPSSSGAAALASGSNTGSSINLTQQPQVSEVNGGNGSSRGGEPLDPPPLQGAS